MPDKTKVMSFEATNGSKKFVNKIVAALSVLLVIETGIIVYLAFAIKANNQGISMKELVF